MSSISTTSIFSYVNEVESALFHQECIRASIDVLKGKLEVLKQQDSEATNNINDILAKAEEFGLAKKTVRLAADERVQSLIASGLLSVTDVEKTVETEVVATKKTRTPKKKKEDTASNEVEDKQEDEKEEVVEPHIPTTSHVIEEASVPDSHEETTSEIEEAVKSDIEDESATDSHVEEAEETVPEETVPEETVPEETVPEETESSTLTQAPAQNTLETRKIPTFLKRSLSS